MPRNKGQQPLVFWMIALLLPLMFFGLMEASLRVFGYGRDLPLFISNPAQPAYMLPRPDIIQRYFSAHTKIPKVSLETNFFLKDKPQNGYRVFVQGGSTAAGFPYGLGASLAGMLDNRLKDSLPKQHVEVINTAMSAVNSYTVLDFADEIISQQPDAILIYMGHNEYLGILGVGSAYSGSFFNGSTLLFLKLRSLRLFQLLQDTYAYFQHNQGEDKTQPDNNRTLMATVAKYKNIPYGSAMYHAGLSQFETNLGLLLDKYAAAKIPVYLATIASNVKDQKPFASDTPNTDFYPQTREISQLLETGESTQATKLIKNIAQSQPFQQNAEAQFALANLHYVTGDFGEAGKLFDRAKDLDLLRFRAPEALNKIIQKYSSRYDNVTLVDVQQRLKQSSKDGLIGHNLMLEHLHPNVQGYFLLADTFYQSLAKNSQHMDWRTVSIQQAWQARPIIPSEEYHGFAKILQLKTDYPFTDTPIELALPPPQDWQQQLGQQYFSKRIDWLTMMRRALAGYQNRKDEDMILKTAQLLADALPQDAQLNQMVADLFRQKKRYHLAIHYYLRAQLSDSSSTKLHRSLIWTYQKNQQPDLVKIWRARLAQLTAD